MTRRPPRSTRMDTLCPSTTLFRSPRRTVRESLSMRAGLVIVAPFNNQIGSEKYAQPCYRHDRRRRPRRDAGSRPGPADRGYAPAEQAEPAPAPESSTDTPTDASKEAADDSNGAPTTDTTDDSSTQPAEPTPEEPAPQHR